MFLFFGITPKTKRYGFVMTHCGAHGGQAYHELASYRSWFKLFFFLPLFPVGREHNVLTCSECGMSYEVDAAEAQQLAAQARQDVDVPMAGGLFGGGGLLGQFFGGGAGGGDHRENRATGYDRYQDPYPTDGYGDDIPVTPAQAPIDPMRVQSKRLDRGA